MISLDRQEAYRRRYAALKPGYRSSNQVYEDLLLRCLAAQSRALDAGCGRAGVLRHYTDRVRQAVGLDSDLASLQENEGLAQKVLGDLTHMPFAEGVFDLVLCTWVVEHLRSPDLAFAEMARVLRRGGRLLLLTPNAWNYVTLVGRLIPARLQRFLVRKIYGRQAGDTFPVAYRANTRRGLEEKLGRVGLRAEEFHYVGDPSYIAFNDLLFGLGVWIERVTDWGPLRALKVHLVASYVKV